jgi:hypothetical protein
MLAAAAMAVGALAAYAQTAPSPDGSAPPTWQHRPHYRAGAPNATAPNTNGQMAAPIERRPAPGMEGSHAVPNAQASANIHNPGPGTGEHLTQWMYEHRNLTPEQQRQALSSEPGFRGLPQPTQQRLLDHLSQLAAMPPDQRQRTLSHAEQIERLNPEQRAEVRSAMLQLGALPPDQRKVVYHAFHELRGMPPEQRLPALNERYRGLSPQQRVTLQQLMHVEPMLPPEGQ